LLGLPEGEWNISDILVYGFMGAGALFTLLSSIGLSLQDPFRFLGNITGALIGFFLFSWLIRGVWKKFKSYRRKISA